MAGPFISFRIATADDAPALVELVQSAYRGDSSRQGWTTEADLLKTPRTDLASMRAGLGAAGTLVIVAESDGHLVACGHLERRPEGAAYFGMFAVRPELQGRGTGRQTIAEAERVARVEWGSDRIRMHVISRRTELISWYERLGYLPTGETQPFPHEAGTPERPDLELLVLQKRLEPLGTTG